MVIDEFQTSADADDTDYFLSGMTQLFLRWETIQMCTSRRCDFSFSGNAPKVRKNLAFKSIRPVEFSLFSCYDNFIQKETNPFIVN